MAAKPKLNIWKTALITTSIVVVGGLYFAGYLPTSSSFGTATSPTPGDFPNDVKNLGNDPSKALAELRKQSQGEEKLARILASGNTTELLQRWTNITHRESDLILMQKLKPTDNGGLLENKAFQEMLIGLLPKEDLSNREAVLVIRLLGRVDQSDREALVLKSIGARKNFDRGQKYFAFETTVPFPAPLAKDLKAMISEKDVGFVRDMMMLSQLMQDRQAKSEIVNAWIKNFDKTFAPMKPYLFKTLSEDQVAGPSFRKNQKLWQARLDKGEGPLWTELRGSAWRQALPRLGDAQ